MFEKKTVDAEFKSDADPPKDCHFSAKLRKPFRNLPTVVYIVCASQFRTTRTNAWGPIVQTFERCPSLGREESPFRHRVQPIARDSTQTRWIRKPVRALEPAVPCKGQLLLKDDQCVLTGSRKRSREPVTDVKKTRCKAHNRN
jgi:hypothetical protein